MNARRVGAEVLLGLRTWVRSPTHVVLNLAMPLVLLLVFGAIFSSSGAERPVALFDDRDHSPASLALRQALAATGTVEVLDAVLPDGPAEAAAWLGKARAAAALTVPAGFGNTSQGVPLQLLLGVGGPYSDGVVASAVRSALAAVQAPQALGLQVASLEARPAASYSGFLLPGVLGLAILSISMSRSFEGVVDMRDRGLLDRLAVSPMRKGEWLLARMASITLVNLAACAVLVAAAWLVFRDPVAVTPLALLLVVLGSLVFAGLGTLVGSAVPSLELGSAIVNVGLLPVILVSGSFFDAARLPAYVRWTSRLSPLTYLNDGLRGELVLGDRATALQAAAVLAVLAVLLVLVGAQTLRWTRDRWTPRWR
ncbi:MAG: ABC transporter permease [Halobacteriales archaeon]|nr:ABC transporter permease [Halobacteriales archaeon]